MEVRGPAERERVVMVVCATIPLVCVEDWGLLACEAEPDLNVLVRRMTRGSSIDGDVEGSSSDTSSDSPSLLIEESFDSSSREITLLLCVVACRPADRGAARDCSLDTSLTIVWYKGLAGGDPDDDKVVALSVPSPPLEDKDDILALLGECEVPSPGAPETDGAFEMEDPEPLSDGPTVREDSLDRSDLPERGDGPRSS